MHVDSERGVWRRAAKTERRGRMKLERESKSGVSDGGGGESGCWGGEARGPSVAPPVDLRVRVVAPVAVAGVEVAKATWRSGGARVRAARGQRFPTRTSCFAQWPTRILTRVYFSPSLKMRSVTGVDFEKKRQPLEVLLEQDGQRQLPSHTNLDTLSISSLLVR